MQWLFIFFALVSTAHAIEIPKNLSSQDRREVLRTLGASTSNKQLSNPYPMGGYWGLEIGITYEMIDTRDIAALGSTATRVDQLSFSRLTIGKGLYNDVDVFVSFVPQHPDLTDFGGMLRWSFFESQHLPVNISLLVYANQINVRDSFTSSNVGSDLMAGINTRDFSLYLGGGLVEANGRFTAKGTNAVVNPAEPGVDGLGLSLKQKLFQSRTFVGITYRLGEYFIAGQIDRYEVPTYSAKIGARF